MLLPKWLMLVVNVAIVAFWIWVMWSNWIIGLCASLCFTLAVIHMGGTTRLEIERRLALVDSIKRAFTMQPPPKEE